ncbi:MAG: exopolysaccharide biosynthesis protein [Blastochloris sp.]|nr:exopolysaccharide biosynthesis protein [Blastochloris sp.]
MTPSPETQQQEFTEGAGKLRALSLSDIFQRMEEESHEHPITIRRMLHHLSGRGYPAVIALFSLPAMLPVVAVPLGFVLFFSGMRMAFGRHLWVPSRIQDYRVPDHRIKEIVREASRLCRWIERFLKPRHSRICLHPWSHRAHGFLVACLGILLPLPLPFTNWLYAIPIVLIGLGLMENDGLVLLLGDIMGLLALLFTFLLVLLGWEGVLEIMRFFQ